MILLNLSLTSTSGTLLYIGKYLSYKPHQDVNIYKKNELESTFIEIMNPKKLNVSVGSIYKHFSIDLTDFNCNYFNNFHEKVLKEHVNVNLLIQITHFWVLFHQNLFTIHFSVNYNNFPHKKTNRKHIYECFSPDSLYGYLTATISDHLPQLVIVPKIFYNFPSSKSNIYGKDWRNLDQEKFILDYFSIDLNKTLKIEA